MRIAFIISYPVFSQSNGIVSQAITWKRGLETIGHEVTLINMWNKNDWESFDIIHFFGFSQYMRSLVQLLEKVNSKIVVSPILDPDYQITTLKLFSRWGSDRLRLTNSYYDLRRIKNHIDLFLVRSHFEQEYILKGFGIRLEKCSIVPLSFTVTGVERINHKENFCLHVSLLTDKRKNVERLIKAAIKYKFKLVLAGKIRNEKELILLKSWIGENNNIEYKGFVTTEELSELYAKAKVFALPSTNEGVGIVALEAASAGCDIVITSLGGPKEYYDGMAKTVNPYNTDEIGEAITRLLHGETAQPDLSKHINSKYSLLQIAQQLESAYLSI